MADEDLKVDYYALERSETDLATLKTEFDTIEKRRDTFEDIWGHSGVKDAMHEFASNMDYNRGKLSEKITQVGDKISNTLETFRGVDAELATSFDKERPAPTGQTAS
jgi:hypothetical protein